MGIDKRKQKTRAKLYSAAVEILSRGRGDLVTVKAFASKAGIAESTVRRVAKSAWDVITLLEGDIRAEFQARRQIQIEEIGVGKKSAHFFMPWFLQFTTTIF